MTPKESFSIRGVLGYSLRDFDSEIKILLSGVGSFSPIKKNMRKTYNLSINTSAALNYFAVLSLSADHNRSTAISLPKQKEKPPGFFRLYKALNSRGINTPNTLYAE